MSTPTVMVRTPDGRHALQHLSAWGTVTDLAGDELDVCPRAVRVCGSGLPLVEWWRLSVLLGGPDVVAARSVRTPSGTVS